MFQLNTYIEIIGKKAYVKEKVSNRIIGYWEDKIFTSYNKEIIDIEYKIIKEEPEIICGKCNMKLTKDNKCGCGEKIDAKTS